MKYYEYCSYSQFSYNFKLYSLNGHHTEKWLSFLDVILEYFCLPFAFMCTLIQVVHKKGMEAFIITALITRCEEAWCKNAVQCLALGKQNVQELSIDFGTVMEMKGFCHV